jgi:hypothetical protein
VLGIGDRDLIARKRNACAMIDGPAQQLQQLRLPPQ